MQYRLHYRKEEKERFILIISINTRIYRVSKEYYPTHKNIHIHLCNQVSLKVKQLHIRGKNVKNSESSNWKKFRST